MTYKKPKKVILDHIFCPKIGHITLAGKSTIRIEGSNTNGSPVEIEIRGVHEWTLRRLCQDIGLAFLDVAKRRRSQDRDNMKFLDEDALEGR